MPDETRVTLGGRTWTRKPFHDGTHGWWEHDRGAYMAFPFYLDRIAELERERDASEAREQTALDEGAYLLARLAAFEALAVRAAVLESAWDCDIIFYGDEAKLISSLAALAPKGGE